MKNMGGVFSNHLSNKIIYTLWPKVGELAWKKVQVKTSGVICNELRESVFKPVKRVIIENMEI